MSDPSQLQSTPSEEEVLAHPGTVGDSDDDALILWMLSLTPTRRLEVAQGFVDSVLALRNGRSA
jgi:hypothetical protein